MPKHTVGKVQCSGRKGDGSQCSRMIHFRDTYCYQHRRQSTNQTVTTYTLTPSLERSTIEKLPPDILRVIMTKGLSVKDIISFSMLNKQFANAICNNLRFWKDLAVLRQVSISPDSLLLVKRELYNQEGIRKCHTVLPGGFLCDRFYTTQFLGLSQMNPTDEQLRTYSLYGHVASFEKLLEDFIVQYALFQESHSSWLEQHPAFLTYYPEKLRTLDEVRQKFDEVRDKMQEYDILRLHWTRFPYYFVFRGPNREWMLHSMPMRAYLRRTMVTYLPTPAVPFLVDLFRHGGKQRMPLTRKRIQQVYDDDVPIYGFLSSEIPPGSEPGRLPVNNRLLFSDEGHPVERYDYFLFYRGGNSRRGLPEPHPVWVPPKHGQQVEVEDEDDNNAE